MQHLFVHLVQLARIAFKLCRLLVSLECIAMLPLHQAFINNVQLELIQLWVAPTPLVLLVDLVLHVCNQEWQLHPITHVHLDISVL